MLNFEEELKKAHLSNKTTVKNNTENIFSDFGMGPAKTLNPYYISQGILI